MQVYLRSEQNFLASKCRAVIDSHTCSRGGMLRLNMSSKRILIFIGSRTHLARILAIFSVFVLVLDEVRFPICDIFTIVRLSHSYDT